MPKWIDLTHPMQESMPSWTGRCGFHKEIKMDYAQGCRVMQYKLHAGIGTHIDAPCHFIPHAKSVADIPIEDLVIPMYVLDISSIVEANTLVSVKDIEAFEKKHGKIEPGSLFLVYSGWSKKWETPAYRNEDEKGKMRYPGFSPQAAEFLVKRDVKGIGIDTLSPDGTNEKYPVHDIILGADRYILENVANLHKVPAKGAIAFAFPIKVVEGAEAPIRLIAYLPEG